MSELSSFPPQPMPHAAAVRGVNYSLQNTQSSHGCPCMKRKRLITTDKHTIHMYVSYSAVNISVTARNAVGNSPPTIVQVLAKRAADLKGRSVCVVDCVTFHEYLSIGRI